MSLYIHTYGKGATCRLGASSRQSNFQKFFTAQDIQRVATIPCKVLDDIYIFALSENFKVFAFASGCIITSGREVALRKIRRSESIPYLNNICMVKVPIMEQLKIGPITECPMLSYSSFHIRVHF
jgi:hypothetical protein